MDFTSTTVAILSTLLGAGGIGTFINWRFGRRKAKADAETAEWTLYDKRLDELHETVAHLNSTEKEHAQRIASLNRALDDKTDRIRMLTDKLYDSEQNLNRANETLTALTADNGQLKLRVEKFKSWHCRVADCPNRMPPNAAIHGKSFNSKS